MLVRQSSTGVRAYQYHAFMLYLKVSWVLGGYGVIKNEKTGFNICLVFITIDVTCL